MRIGSRSLCPRRWQRLGSRVGAVGTDVASYVSTGHYLSSPVDLKRSPATGFPEATNSRMLARFGPACSIAEESVCRACERGVSCGKRKIHGMLVEVSARSEEMATTGTNDFTGICS